MVLRDSSEVACLVYVVLGLLLSCRCKKRGVQLNNCSIKRGFSNLKIESHKTNIQCLVDCPSQLISFHVLQFAKNRFNGIIVQLGAHSLIQKSIAGKQIVECLAN